MHLAILLFDSKMASIMTTGNKFISEEINGLMYIHEFVIIT